MYRVARIELVITFDRIRDFSVINGRVYVSITETDSVGSRAASQGEEIAKDSRTVDLEGFNFGRVRDAKLIGREKSEAQISQSIRPFTVAGEIVLTDIQNVRGGSRRARREAGDSWIPVSTGEALKK